MTELQTKLSEVDNLLRRVLVNDDSVLYIAKARQTLKEAFIIAGQKEEVKQDG